MSEWLSSSEIAQLAGVSVRRVKYIIKRSFDGRTWNGAKLEVRTVEGR